MRPERAPTYRFLVAVRSELWAVPRESSAMTSVCRPIGSVRGTAIYGRGAVASAVGPSGSTEADARPKRERLVVCVFGAVLFEFGAVLFAVGALAFAPGPAWPEARPGGCAGRPRGSALRARRSSLA